MTESQIIPKQLQQQQQQQQPKPVIGQLNSVVTNTNTTINTNITSNSSHITNTINNHTTVVAAPAATKQTIQPLINVVWNQDLFRKHSGETPQIISAKTPTLMTSMNKYLHSDNVMVYQLSSNSMNSNSQKIKIQNIISVGGGENSSAYESSEDTGVGELSESELITAAQDGIGMFYMVTHLC